jgi:hypothetical protein
MFPDSVLIYVQRWTGAFHAPLVLQVFSVYFSIINGGSLVDNLKYGLSSGQPRAALALAVIAVRCFSLRMLGIT